MFVAVPAPGVKPIEDVSAESPNYHREYVRVMWGLNEIEDQFKKTKVQTKGTLTAIRRHISRRLSYG